MSLNRNSAIAAVATVSIAALAGGAAAAATLVVRSSGPSAALYAPGKSLADGATIALKPADSLTLLDARGTRVLRGPGRFAVGGSEAAAGAGGAARVATLIGGASGDRRVRIGAVRGVGGSTRRTLWVIDAAAGGTVCLLDPATATLWRDDAARDATVAIGGERGATANLAWPAGAHAIRWPESLPVAAGARYTLTGLGGGAAATTVRFAVLSPVPDGAEATAAALIRNGCTAQLDRLVEAASASGTPAAPAG